jgi:hypothetical protein
MEFRRRKSSRRSLVNLIKYQYILRCPWSPGSRRSYSKSRIRMKTARATTFGHDKECLRKLDEWWIINIIANLLLYDLINSWMGWIIPLYFEQANYYGPFGLVIFSMLTLLLSRGILVESWQSRLCRKGVSIRDVHLSSMCLDWYCWVQLDCVSTQRKNGV